MPGMEALAPERTENNRGFFASPNLAPMAFSVFAILSSTSAQSFALILHANSLKKY
jgi:hypothetical protein